jgi:hypothetical protein
VRREEHLSDPDWKVVWATDFVRLHGWGALPTTHVTGQPQGQSVQGLRRWTTTAGTAVEGESLAGARSDRKSDCVMAAESTPLRAVIAAPSIPRHGLPATRCDPGAPSPLSLAAVPRLRPNGCLLGSTLDRDEPLSSDECAPGPDERPVGCS